MHGIIPRLTPLVLDNFGLAEALTDLVERTRRSQPNVVLNQSIDLGNAPIPPDVALALFRSAQEGITNALRHGEAGQLELNVAGSVDQVCLTLRDDGRGLPPEGIQRAGHHGLRWLTERVEGLAGTLRIEPAATRGARLTVQIPLPGAAR
jgi:two-component system sensor histidine kinase UhpB